MIKKNKLSIIISSVAILLPILFGVIMWKDLPDIMTTHFGADGNADGFGSKAFAVFGIPVIFLILHFACVLLTLADKKQKEQSSKALSMIFWIVPVISLFVNAIIYSVALGRGLTLTSLIPAILGAAFVFMGNYLPKVKQNSTFGIKLYWTLNNEENWNKTHRFAGKLWVACGLLVLSSVFLPQNISFIVILCAIALSVIIPVIYSSKIFRQHKKEGIIYSEAPKSGAERMAKKISAVAVPLLLIGVAVLMCTGSIEVKCEDDFLRVDATYWTDAAVEYSKIDDIEYRKELDVGLRTNGFASAKLSVGIFQNEEFGSYTLYSYTGAREFIVLTSEDKTLVIGIKNAEDAQPIYDMILKKIG